MNTQFIERIQEIVNGLSPELSQLTLNIYNNPELGGEEFKACKWQTDLLKKYHFQIEDNFCQIPTAYKAAYKGAKPGPKIAMLAEYDALPELGHGCGHNLIAMISVGSAIAMREFADQLGGEIYVIGTPAEETRGAKVEMAKKGAFKDFDVAMMAHPNEISGSSLNTMAMCARKFEFFGKTAHAAASPFEGINALDAMINFFNLINALRQQTKPDARIHGIIRNGGVAPNIIPDYTEGLFYIRATKAAYVEELLEKVTACAEGAAKGTGCTFKVSPEEEDFMDTCSNMTLSDLVCDQYERLGHKMMRLGKMSVPGSSDLGDVSYQCPAVQLMCGMGPAKNGQHYGPHTAEFAEKAGSTEAIENGLEFVKAFTMTAVELFTKPDLLEAIKKEFDTEDEDFHLG